MSVVALTGELDIEQPEQLLAYLRRTGRIAPGAEVRVRPLPGGVSARTVLVEHDPGPAWVVKQALPKLRVQTAWFSDPERIHREAEALRVLGTLLPPGSTPRFLFEDRHHHLLAMEAVPQPHRSWKAMLLAGDLHERHLRQFGRLLAQLHSAPLDDGLIRPFADRSFFESLRLEPYYAYTAGQVPAAADFFAALIADTRAVRLTLVHGDYSPKNVLVHEDRLVLLDHEVMHQGDPAFDIGFSLTHLLSKAHHLPGHRDAFGTGARLYWQSYAEGIAHAAWHAAVQQRAIRHTLGCLLARVAGRSPLEYLSPAARRRQQEIVVSMLAPSPASMPDLIDAFLARL